MKRKFIVMLIFIGLISSMGALAQNNAVKLSMTFKNEKLQSALLKLESVSSYKFIFSYEDIDTYTVDGSFKDVSFNEAVKFVLKGTPLSYSTHGKFVTIKKKQDSKKKKGEKSYGMIGGYVFDDKDKQPLIGAQIQVVGTNKYAITDLDGAFHFTHAFASDSKLKVSYVGMQSAIVDVTDDIKIYLKEDNHVLQDVVVTGIFRKSKDSYTGALTSISKDQLKMFKGSNLLQTIKNIDASINFPINNIAGSNPNVLPDINIRGASTLPMNVEEFNSNAQQSVNTPLIIMDGFEISLTKLMDYNNEQIESINILKDASATAIYGSRGSNGVIVVVTKKPEEGKLRVTLKAGLNLQLPDLSSYNMLNAAEKLELERKVGLYTGKASTQYVYDNLYNERLAKVLNGTDVDWLKQPVRNGVGQQYNLQLDGGANEFRWAASLGYNDIEGAMKGSSRKTVNGDITLMYSVKNLIFRNYTSYSSNNSQESKYGSFQDYVNQQPYNSPYDADGNIVKTFDSFMKTSQVGNPLYDATLNTFNKSEYMNFMDNFSIEWNILDGLRFRAKLGYSTTRSTSDLFLPAEHSTFTASEYNTADGVLRKGSYTYGTGKTDMYSANATVSYTKTFAKKHQLYAGVDYSISETRIHNYQFVAEGFSNEDLSFLGNATQYQYGSAPTASQSLDRIVGVTGNANYTYDNRYFADLSYRIDGSSKFGSDKRFAPFWSAGLGWNMHNEKWLKDNNILNTLRLRASYGITGSQNFSTQSVNTTYKYVSGNRYLNWAAATMMGLGNSRLTWQKTNELNLGFEFGLFKNRITGEFDYYTKKTNDLLSSMDLPHSVGFSSYTSNVGAMSNEGIEASINAYIIRDSRKQFNWMVGAQFIYDKNEITELSQAIMDQNEKYLSQNVEVSNLFYVGRPLNSIYAVRSLGIDPSTGEEVYMDKNGNVTNTWNASDKVFLGSSQPLYRGNLRTMVMWKDFTMNVSFGYHWGGKTYNTTLRNRVEVSTFDIQDQNVDRRVLTDRWMIPGDDTFFKGFSPNTTHATSRYVFNDRMLSLQSVSLQYHWKSHWLKDNTGMEAVLFGVNMSDLFYWSSIKNERGTSYPYARTLQASATLTF